MNERFILEQNNNTFCKVEGNKNDEFWNVTRRLEVKNNHFWEWEQNKNEFLFGNGKEQF